MLVLLKLLQYGDQEASAVVSQAHSVKGDHVLPVVAHTHGIEVEDGDTVTSGQLFDEMISLETFSVPLARTASYKRTGIDGDEVVDALLLIESTGFKIVTLLPEILADQYPQ